MTIIIFSWLTLLTISIGIVNMKYVRKYNKLEANVKYLLPFIQDKTLKALTSYIEDNNNELTFDENGELLEKSELKEIKSENLFNDNFTPLPVDCKVSCLEEAIHKKLVHKIAKYRFSIDRNKIFTRPGKVCLFWKPGTIFADYYNKSLKEYSLFVIKNNNKCQWLYSCDEKLIGSETVNDFSNFLDRDIELLALPEEYLK